MVHYGAIFWPVIAIRLDKQVCPLTCIVAVVRKKLMKIVNHWLLEADQCCSPNQDERPADAVIDSIVIHNISLPPGEFGGGHVSELFCNRLDETAHPYFKEICHLQVSAHVLIERNGACTQYVGFDQRAWHAGQSYFKGRQRFNDFSIGIELEGADDVLYERAQYDKLAQITHALLTQYSAITVANIVGHETISPGRKTDPGAAFDWQRYRASVQSADHT